MLEKMMEAAGVPECTPGEWAAQFAMTQEYLSTIKLPAAWRRERLDPNDPMFGVGMYMKGGARNGLKVLVDCSTFWDKTRWVHVTCSRRNKMPTYEELVEVKAVFIGPDRQAIQCFPKKEKHINIHPFCLHLWCCLDGDGLPDFGRFGTI